MPLIQIQTIPAFDDNYLWLIHNSQKAIVVDPGDAAPVQRYLDQNQLQLCAILLTHHHADHIGGVDALLAKAPNVAVYWPQADQQSGRITHITHACHQGSQVEIAELGLQFGVLEVPGHTSSHIAYYCASLSSLFCGDTMFAGGCGRLFEGTPAQMVDSLAKITRLPGATKVYCAHEYTLSNLLFAIALEPGNQNLQQRLSQVRSERERNIATVPSTLDVELQTNPFLRTNSAEIIGTLLNNNKISASDDSVEIFAAIREWKNHFKAA